MLLWNFYSSREDDGDVEYLFDYYIWYRKSLDKS